MSSSSSSQCSQVPFPHTSNCCICSEVPFLRFGYQAIGVPITLLSLSSTKILVSSNQTFLIVSIRQVLDTKIFFPFSFYNLLIFFDDTFGQIKLRVQLPLRKGVPLFLGNNHNEGSMHLLQYAKEYQH